MENQKRQRRLLVWFALWAMWVVATPSLAQADPEGKAALQAYQKGYQHYYHKRWKKALEHFQRALRRAPPAKKSIRARKIRLALHYYIGMSLYQLQKWAVAKKHLDHYLSSKGGKPKLQQKARIALQQIEAKLQATPPPPERRPLIRRPPSRRPASPPPLHRVARRPPPRQPISKREKAKEFTQQGHRLFLQSRYQEAKQSYLRAIHSAPSFAEPYRAMGVTFARLGRCSTPEHSSYHPKRCQKAIFYYEKYLQRAPDAEDAPRIRKIIDRFRKKRLARRQRLQRRSVPRRSVPVRRRPTPARKPAREKPAPTREEPEPRAQVRIAMVPLSRTRERVAPPPKKGGGPSVFSYILLGVGTAAVGSGIFFGALALDSYSRSKNLFEKGPEGEAPAKSVSSLQQEAEGQALVSYISYGVGGALVVTGIVLLFTTGQKAPPTKQTAILLPLLPQQAKAQRSSK